MVLKQIKNQVQFIFHGNQKLKNALLSQPSLRYRYRYIGAVVPHTVLLHTVSLHRYSTGTTYGTATQYWYHIRYRYVGIVPVPHTVPLPIHTYSTGTTYGTATDA